MYVTERAEHCRLIRIDPVLMNKVLRTIAVDLTSVLAGGENGGTRIFVLELLRRLAEIAPQAQFVLLTQAASHEDLGTLDRPNMRRLMVQGSSLVNDLRPGLLGLASGLLPHLPAGLRRVVGGVGYKLNLRMKRRGTAGLLHSLGADLLFCPFTTLTYFESGIPAVCTIYDLQYKKYPEFFWAEYVISSCAPGLFRQAGNALLSFLNRSAWQASIWSYFSLRLPNIIRVI